MDSNSNDFSTTLAQGVATEFEDESGPSLSTDQESTPSGSGMESLPLSVVQTIEDKKFAPETIEVRHGKQGINVRLTPQVNTAMFNLITLGLHRPSLTMLMAMLNLGKAKFEKQYKQSHCALCGCNVPKGKPGRTCKPCRGIAYSAAELGDPNVMKSQLHHIGYARTVATDARIRLAQPDYTVEKLAELYNVPLSHLEFILKYEPETTGPTPTPGDGNTEACEGISVAPVDGTAGDSNND